MIVTLGPVRDFLVKPFSDVPVEVVELQFTALHSYVRREVGVNVVMMYNFCKCAGKCFMDKEVAEQHTQRVSLHRRIINLIDCRKVRK